MKKSVYLIQSLDDGNYKIGISANPSKRLEQLQTGNSSKLKIVDTYLTENYSFVEKALHNRFGHDNTRGEWFYLDIEEVTSFTKHCEMIDNNITLLKKSDNPFIL